MTQELLAPGFTNITQAAVGEVSRRHDEPAWLRQHRLDAWRAYEAMDFPAESDEEWRRTDVRSIVFNGIRPYAESAGPRDLPSAIEDVVQGEDTLAGRFVQQDSGVVRTELREDLRAKGVILMDLHTAAREHPQLVEKYLSNAVKPDEWKYIALNAAMWSGGCFLYVPKGVVIDAPIHLSFDVSEDGLAVFPHTIVVAERETEVTFIDEVTSPDGVAKRFVSGAVEIYAGDGAKLSYYSINRWGNNVYNFNTVRARLGRDSQFLCMAAGIGSKLTKMRIDTEMPESGAEAKLLGLTFGDGDQHFDYNTLQNHFGKHTISDLQFKSAMTDSSSIVWYGITRINPTAGGSEANQTSRNMLLSEHAKAAPIPILEIEAWDVTKCSHGATAGPVDENELFYLESRAIPKDVAEHMLVEGFFADVVDRISDERLRERVMDAVLQKAGGSAGALTYDEVLSA